MAEIAVAVLVEEEAPLVEAAVSAALAVAEASALVEVVPAVVGKYHFTELVNFRRTFKKGVLI